ncbi:MAG: DinB family protein [bacterium]
MDSRLDPIAQLYTVNNGLFAAATKDLGQEQIRARFGQDKGNSLLWVAGHVVESRYVLGRLIGLEDHWEHGELFARGAKVQDEAVYPEFDVIEAAFGGRSKQLPKRFEELASTQLEAELTIPFPVDKKDVLHSIAFLALHESYHTGQMVYIRRLLGGDQVVG